MVLNPQVADVDSAVSRQEAFVALADHQLQSSYRLARAILGNTAAAEDATHDALVTAWRKWATLRDPNRFEAWFGRILVHTCRNTLRREALHPMRDISADLAPTVPDEYDRLHERDRVRAALAHLEPDQQIVVALRFYADLPVDEIANRLNTRSGTVKSRLHRALRKLEQVLRETDGEEVRG